MCTVTRKVTLAGDGGYINPLGLYGEPSQLRRVPRLRSNHRFAIGAGHLIGRRDEKGRGPLPVGTPPGEFGVR